jgi:AcrR family transcriptional regulator
MGPLPPPSLARAGGRVPDTPARARDLRRAARPCRAPAWPRTLAAVTDPAPVGDGADNGRAPRRIRKSSAARRAQLIDAAVEVLAAGGSTSGGMADIADAAGVSNGLLYHYFPGGRPEVLAAAAEQVLDELGERLAGAANVPFSPLGRLEQVLAALVAYLVERPVAHRLLVAEADGAVRGDGAPGVARVRLVSLVSMLLADSARSADDLVAGAMVVIDDALTGVDDCLAGRTDPETVWRSSCRRARELFPGS